LHLNKDSGLHSDPEIFPGFFGSCRLEARYLSLYISKLMKQALLALLFLLSATVSPAQEVQLTTTLAEQLARLPLKCIEQEFPNKTGHSADGPEDARLLPSELHPSFYGCFDWHSSVHGHWMLVKLLKDFPDLSNRDSIIQVLAPSFTSERMKAEA